MQKAYGDTEYENYYSRYFKCVIPGCTADQENVITIRNQIVQDNK